MSCLSLNLVAHLGFLKITQLSPCAVMIQYLIQTPVSSNLEWAKAWGPILIGIVTIVVGIVTTLLVQRSKRAESRSTNEARKRQFDLLQSKEERDEIVKKLNGFYVPFKHLRAQSRILYAKFATELMREYNKKTGKRFRTLRYLLEGGLLDASDTEILTQILALGQEQLRLIESHSGVADKPELQALLGKLGAHIRILQLAAQRKLTRSPEEYEDIVFPLEIDGAIESAFLRLQDRLTELNLQAEPVGSKESYQCDQSTINYYDQNAEDYSTISLSKEISQNLPEFYNEFTKHLARGARILDAGCGVGRDARHFIEEGFTVIAFDASREMVRKCQEYPHAYCKKMTFAELEFKEEFDGVWACASLLHLKRPEARQAVKRLTTALKFGGVMYIALKVGKQDNDGYDKVGRYFTYYDEDSAKELYELDGRLDLESQKRSGTSGKNGKEFLNLILVRKPVSL